MENIVKKTVAECLGTFVLVFFACGTAIVTYSMGVNVVATALAFGLVIIAMAYSIGGISGCHINPAVSIAMLINKKLNLKEFAFYLLGQFMGAIIGAAALYGILKGLNIHMPILATNGVPFKDAAGYISAIAFEIVLTFVFVYTILCVTSKNENSKIAGIVIGLTLTLVHLIGIKITGTSVNPARSFGPALMSLAFDGGTDAISVVWIFIIAPLAGGVVAAYVYRFLNASKNELPVKNKSE